MRWCLPIGMVVDDAIVVLENIHRHIEQGMTVREAALQGAREIAMPVISMSITLAAVYAPIGLMGGMTGQLFSEFAFTLAATVVLSGVVALTLSPMLCSKVMAAEGQSGRFSHFIDKVFSKLQQFYKRRLHSTLDFRPVTLLMAAVVLSSCFFLYTGTSKELAPQEDQSMLFMPASGPQYANINYTQHFTDQLAHILHANPNTFQYMIINGANGVNSAISLDVLKPWGDRKLSQKQIQKALQAQVSKIAGLQIPVVGLPALPSGSGPGAMPFEFVLTSTGDYPELYKYSQRLLNDAKKSGIFLFVRDSLSFDKPQMVFHIDSNKAASMGISMQEIGAALETSLGGNFVNQFDLDGQSYKVIPQLLRSARWNPQQISQINIKTSLGAMVPLSTIVSIKQTVVPNSYDHFQQLNSASLQGVLAPGHTESEALVYMQQAANKILPQHITYNYGGQLRQYVEEGDALILTFFFSIIIIFLILSAQFESFRDPIIILLAVPMSICGALIPLYIGLATINIYTQIGLITLIGLISKHGILMVEFANKLRSEKKLSIRDAIEEAAAVRLRPILMTTAAMVLGVMPLIFASGAGAMSRYDMGLVIAFGMTIGTLFTLFVLPAIYTLLASKKVHSIDE